MRKKHYFLSLASVAVVTMILSIFTCKAENEPVPGDTLQKEHSQVVGCGSKLPIDWRPGCCLGVGGCVNRCNNDIQYCD